MQAVGPHPLAELVKLALPRELADQAHHGVVALAEIGGFGAGDEVRLRLDEDADWAVWVGRGGEGGGGGGWGGVGVH